LYIFEDVSDCMMRLNIEEEFVFLLPFEQDSDGEDG
jgi:hypothetical protein